jgi:hypothetical protein
MRDSQPFNMKAVFIVFGLIFAFTAFGEPATPPSWETQTNILHEGDYFAGRAERLGPVQLWLRVGAEWAWGRAFLPGRGERSEVSGTPSTRGLWLLTLEGPPTTPAAWKAFTDKSPLIILTVDGELREQTNGFMLGKLAGKPPAFVGEWISTDQRTRIPLRLSHVSPRRLVEVVTGLRSRKGKYVVYHRATSAYPLFPLTTIGWDLKRPRSNEQNRDDYRSRVCHVQQNGYDRLFWCAGVSVTRGAIYRAGS